MIGNIIMKVINEKGIKKKERIKIGEKKVVRKEIKEGEIEIYKEYKGNEELLLKKEEDKIWKEKEKD